MYTSTCSSDSTCGNCGKKNTDGDAVTCSSSVQPAKPNSTVCTFCADNLRECCTLPVCALTNGVTMNTAGTNCQCGTSDCTSTTGLFCQSNTCHTSAFGSAALPNGDGSAISPGSLGKVVSDWIGGGALKDTVITTYGSIEDWDVSDVTNMYAVFLGKSRFNADLSKWNVAAVTNMRQSTYNFTSFLSSLFYSIVSPSNTFLFLLCFFVFFVFSFLFYINNCIYSCSVLFCFCIQWWSVQVECCCCYKHVSKYVQFHLFSCLSCLFNSVTL